MISRPGSVQASSRASPARNAGCWAATSTRGRNCAVPASRASPVREPGPDARPPAGQRVEVHGPPSALARSAIARSPNRSLCHPDRGSKPCPSSWTSSETPSGSYSRPSRAVRARRAATMLVSASRRSASTSRDRSPSSATGVPADTNLTSRWPVLLAQATSERERRLQRLAVQRRGRQPQQRQPQPRPAPRPRSRWPADELLGRHTAPSSRPACPRGLARSPAGWPACRAARQHPVAFRGDGLGPGQLLGFLVHAARWPARSPRAGRTAGAARRRPDRTPAPSSRLNTMQAPMMRPRHSSGTPITPRSVARDLRGHVPAGSRRRTGRTRAGPGGRRPPRSCPR